MEILIDPHTLERAEERGANEEKVKDVIETGFTIPAKYGRKGKAKIFTFDQTKLGKYYEQRRMEVSYIAEGNAIITVMAYVFYGKWEDWDGNSL